MLIEQFCTIYKGFLSHQLGKITIFLINFFLKNYTVLNSYREKLEIDHFIYDKISNLNISQHLLYVPIKYEIIGTFCSKAVNKGTIC